MSSTEKRVLELVALVYEELEKIEDERERQIVREYVGELLNQWKK